MINMQFITNKVIISVFVAFCMVMSLTNCSTHLASPSTFYYNTKGNRNSTEDGGDLGTLQQDLDHCSEIRSKLNHMDNLAACLEKEIIAIVYRVMDSKKERATTGRRNSNRKPQVISGLMIMGLLIPTLFSILGLFAKKALISSLVALALSIYAVTKSKGGSLSQNYQVEDPYGPAKYREFKSNSAGSGPFEFSNINNIPIPSVTTQTQKPSRPHDDTKYFNPPAKEEESESLIYKNIEAYDNGYNNRIYKSQKTGGPTEYYEYYTQSTPSSYEVTERNDIGKHRKSLCSTGLESHDKTYNKVINNQDETTEESEERCSHKIQPFVETRNGKGTHYDAGDSSHYESRESSSHKQNIYKNSDSYRTTTNKNLIPVRAADGDQNFASSEKNRETNSNFSNKLTSGHFETQRLPVFNPVKQNPKVESSEDLAKQIVRTEINVYTNHRTTEGDDNVKKRTASGLL